MDAIGLLRKYQAIDFDGTELTEARTNRDFAALIGVHESNLSRYYDGKQPVGMKALRGLRRAFPQSAREIRSILLAGPLEGLIEDEVPVAVPA